MTIQERCEAKLQETLRQHPKLLARHLSKPLVIHPRVQEAMERFLSQCTEGTVLRWIPLQEARQDQRIDGCHALIEQQLLIAGERQSKALVLRITEIDGELTWRFMQPPLRSEPQMNEIIEEITGIVQKRR